MAPISFEKANAQGLLKDTDLKRLAAALLANIDNFKVQPRAYKAKVRAGG